MSQFKCVKVCYKQHDLFNVPKNINLEDKEQVKFWGVKYNRLHIQLTNGKEIIIDSQGWFIDDDYKEPNEVNVVNAEEEFYNFDEDDFEEVDVGNEKKCNHIWECGCSKEVCEDCKNEKNDVDLCGDETCKNYYTYRNDNCNCNGCGYCDAKKKRRA